MKLVFKPENNYKEEIKIFLSEVLGPNHPSLNKKLFDWYYNSNRFNESNCLSFILAIDNDQIIALLGFYEVPIRVEKEIIDGAWAALWYSKKSSFSGVGGLLMRKLIEKYNFVGALACSEINQQMVKYLGFKIIEEIPSFIYILSPGNLKNLISKKINFSSKKLFKNNIDIDRNCYTNSQSVKERKIVSIAEKNKLSIPILSTFKDQHYLDWRYYQHPFFDYFWSFIEWEGDIKSWIVWRIAELNGVYLCRIVDFDIIDFLPNKRYLILKLIDELTNYLNKLNCDYIDFYTTNNLLAGILLEYGFVSNNSYKFPNLIDPPCNDSLILNGEYYLSHEIIKLKNIEFWAYRSDGDVDRPNLSIL